MSLTVQDKWRNLHVMANGWGSRQRGKIASKSAQPISKRDDDSMALTTVVDNDMEVPDAKPLETVSETLPDVDSKKPITRLPYFPLTQYIQFDIQILMKSQGIQ